jgi:metallophosphoesterase (TIGR00282 family)
MFKSGGKEAALKVLFFGDIIGKPGRRALKGTILGLLEKYGCDLVIANCENAAGGFGLTVDTAEELFDAGVDVLTSGNHIWDKREIMDYIDKNPKLLRPDNYPKSTPGSGYIKINTRGGTEVCVMNLVGRIYMGYFDDPFERAVEIISEVKTPITILDFHGEDTREKVSLAHFLDGRISAVIGTHTHVQTADERILPAGTAYITDAGMTGPMDSVIGVKKERALARFLTSIPQRFETAKGGVEARGVFLEIDKKSGKSLNIERFCEKYPKKESDER